MPSEFTRTANEIAARIISEITQSSAQLLFPQAAALLTDSVKTAPAWELALPVLACQAAGGSLETGQAAGRAWYAMYLASEILDSVEDHEFAPGPFVLTPETATNIATAFIFYAFHALTDLPDQGRASRVFADAGLSATSGQHRDLSPQPVDVDRAVDSYWEIILQKSGSIFRMAAEGGGAAGSSDPNTANALREYGTSLGVLLQVIDDCRDAFSADSQAVHWEVSLPLLLYWQQTGVDNPAYPAISTRAEWSALLQETGIHQMIASMLLELQNHAVESLQPLVQSPAKKHLESIPALILNRLTFKLTNQPDDNTD